MASNPVRVVSLGMGRWSDVLAVIGEVVLTLWASLWAWVSANAEHQVLPACSPVVSVASGSLFVVSADFGPS